MWHGLLWFNSPAMQMSLLQSWKDLSARLKELWHSWQVYQSPFCYRAWLDWLILSLEDCCISLGALTVVSFFLSGEPWSQPWYAFGLPLQTNTPNIYNQSQPVKTPWKTQQPHQQTCLQSHCLLHRVPLHLPATHLQDWWHPSQLESHCLSSCYSVWFMK